MRHHVEGNLVAASGCTPSAGASLAVHTTCTLHLSRPKSNRDTFPGLLVSVVLTATLGRKAASRVWSCTLHQTWAALPALPCAGQTSSAHVEEPCHFQV